MDNQDFKKLQALWYKKLEKSGFNDIESSTTNHLENNATSVGVIDKRRVTWESQAEYYRLATYFLNDYPFNTHLEKVIWEYHSNGISFKDIANILNKVRKKKIHYKTVERINSRLQVEMKKMYGVIK